MKDDNRPIVVDASVVIKWFNEEEGTPAALRLLGKITAGALTAFVPDLILYEVLNVLIRALGKSPEEIDDAFNILGALPWDLVPPGTELLRDAAALAANRPRLTAYDAAYVALALRKNAILWTADKHLHRTIGEPVTRLL